MKILEKPNLFLKKKWRALRFVIPRVQIALEIFGLFESLCKDPVTNGHDGRDLIDSVKS